jgi:regulator of sirC expression with transglutaminase-like and TPR domain
VAIPDADPLTELIAVPEAQIDLTRAALAIARLEYPELEFAPVEGQLALLAEAAAAQLASAETVGERVARLSEYLYGQAGFRGNRSDYYDLRNSFLNDVVERRMGIPITLGLVYIDVAARLGLDVRGIGFPGHFLVKCVDSGEIVVDPFSGDVLSPADCERLFHSALGDKTPFDPRALAESPKRQTLARVLGNLKQIHLARGEFARALSCVDRILALRPDDPAELRDRGLLYAKLECFRAAADDLERFLALAPDDPTAPGITANLGKLRERARQLN